MRKTILFLIAFLAIFTLRPVVANAGELYFPLAGRDNSSINTGYSESHGGISIDVYPEDTVVSVYYGKVFIVNDCIMVDHDDSNLWSMYYGLTEFHVSNGEEVVMGTSLGKIGNSNSFYFQMQEEINDSYITLNPEHYIEMNYVAPPPEPEQSELIKGAIWAVNNCSWLYGQNNADHPNPRDIVGAMSNGRYIRDITYIRSTDCSAFVASMFIQYKGIDMRTGSWLILEDARDGVIKNGYKCQLYRFDGDTSWLLPEDVLWKQGHAGLYIGDGQQVYQTSGNNGPYLNNDLSAYTHVIRWVKI